MIYVFGNCELDIQHSELRCAGRSIKLERQVFRVLAYLVQHRHGVVTRQELFEQLQLKRFVSDWTLARCIALARQALGDSGRLTGHSALAAKRKQVTALCCIIANALGLAGQLGPESMHHLVHEFFALALREAQRYEGHITQYIGYGFLAMFGALVAYEDDQGPAGTALASSGVA
jgi:class 3 adenylate cyclase